jgi:hypothetical protein
MSSLLRIGGDPTTWHVSTTIGPLSSSSGPMVLDVDEPLRGVLLLSPRAMGSAVMLPMPGLDYHHGHAPNGIILPQQAWLYVPSTTGPDPFSNPQRLYLVAKNIVELHKEITAAMTQESFVTLDLAPVADPSAAAASTGDANTGDASTGDASAADYGSIVLNFGALPFVVLCLAPPGA